MRSTEKATPGALDAADRLDAVADLVEGYALAVGAVVSSLNEDGGANDTARLFMEQAGRWVAGFARGDVAAARL